MSPTAEINTGQQDVSAQAVDVAASQKVNTAIEGALLQLGEDARMSIVLHYLEGFSHPEISRVTGLSSAQVTRRIGEGLTILRKRLTEAGWSFPALAMNGLLRNQDLLPAPPSLRRALARIQTGHRWSNHGHA